MSNDLIKRENISKILKDAPKKIPADIADALSDIPAAKALEISPEDFATLCICALRYCMGRRTYMPSLVQGIILSCFDYIPDSNLRTIHKEKSMQAHHDLYGDSCDKISWEQFWESFEKKAAEKDGLNI